MKRVALGNTGLSISPLVMGTGTRNGDVLRSLGRENFRSTVARALERGITSFDTAEQYGNMPDWLGEVIRGRDVFINVKTADYGADMARKVDEFRRRLGVERIGSVLLHCLCDPNWPVSMRRPMDELETLKQRGIIQAHGISAHNQRTVRASAGVAWMDVGLFRLNPYGIRIDGLDGCDSPDGSPVEPCVESIALVKRENTCGLLGMKLFCDGYLQKKEERFHSLQWVVNTGLFHAYVAGLTTPAEVDEFVDHYESVRQQE